MRVRPSEITLLLAISLFFGLAVEEFAAQDIPNRPGAVPTFPLLALAGAALLLAGRREMHRSAARLSIEEVFTAGKFLLLVGVVLALLPQSADRVFERDHGAQDPAPGDSRLLPVLWKLPLAALCPS
ncbi:MAG: hypothetical protein ACYCX6_11745 [Vulcanimicrobiaceae bacterium]